MRKDKMLLFPLKYALLNIVCILGYSCCACSVHGSCYYCYVTVKTCKKCATLLSTSFVANVSDVANHDAN